MAATIKCDTIQNAGSATVNAYLDGNGNLSVGNSTSPSATSTGNINASGTVIMGSSFLRNRIINGDMRIDQRNAGASVTPADGSYTLDRWVSYNSQASKYSVQQNAGSITPPAGFTNYFGVTSSSAYSVTSTDTFTIVQNIEGFNAADFAFGTASAKALTLSFWVRSSLTGTFGGSISNSALNRSYPFSYSISSANTWEQKTVAITGDTTGTWVTNNGVGLRVWFSLGAGSSIIGTAGSWVASDIRGATGQTSVVGTNGATFYITGVQLEVGSVATPFERRQYGQELALCQRYLPAYNANGSTSGLIAPGFEYSTTNAAATVTFPVTARVAPTGITVSNATHFNFNDTAAHAATAITLGGLTSPSACQVTVTSTGFTNGYGGQLFFNNASGQLLFTGCEL